MWRKVSLALVIVLGGCASMPDELAVPEGTQLAAYNLAREGQEVGKTARWGGLVTEVTNLKDKTRVEVVFTALTNSGKPSLENPSPGRFYAYLDGFVDPVSIPQGYRIALVGKVQPSEKGQVGEYQYNYPVMAVQNFKLWAPQQDTDRYYADPWWPYWRYPYGYWGDPFFYNSYYYPRYRVRSTGPKVPKPDYQGPVRAPETQKRKQN
ncbi:Slp family lipoprotein [Gallaecimonas xiamenensis]|uniref:Slp family outer membrane lipoprotein n=1 Tax=Gallaecimonas xiamenensis 3-C-1 TaxID=745411 RepID=K2IGB6_9GAMM|nr:Slp family lipoprotein [Gallaecimonas xiamenensis]EKE69116.1 Slp family outer membrane lipoprotein [Gallaecimonas xiamenensis 3-C-1]